MVVASKIVGLRRERETERKNKKKLLKIIKKECLNNVVKKLEVLLLGIL